MESPRARHCWRKEVPVSPALPALTGYSTFTAADVNQNRTAAAGEATDAGLQLRELAAAARPGHGSARRGAHSAVLCGSRPALCPCWQTKS